VVTGARVLNRIWLSFFFIAFACALWPVLHGDWSRVDAIQKSLFDMSKLSAVQDC
jgi:spore maturation protein SpmA